MSPPEILLLATVALPLALAGLLALPGRPRDRVLMISPWAPLPALALALLAAPGTSLDLPWLLLGSTFGVDATGRIFLLFTGTLWLLAGIYAHSYITSGKARFFAYHLITLSGNLGLVLAQDMVSFYLAFVLMTLAAFGLIVHESTRQARHAALVYLVMAIAGEALLLFGVILAAHRVGGVELPYLSGSDIGASASLLLLLGFGVKAGLPLLHMWLPLAHPQAPTPASAVLSGAMIKAGLLGWLRFLPLGIAALPWLGGITVAAGLVAIYLGAMLGIMQRQPKALLAYSSISQMGFMTVALGVALLLPAVWPAAAGAVTLFAFHHAMTKGALFLGTGLVQHAGDERPGQRRFFLAGLVLAAASLTGLPVTGGALAKKLVKETLHPVVELGAWGSVLPHLLTLGAIGSGLLMLRFLTLVSKQEANAVSRAPPAMWLSWSAALVLVAGGSLLSSGGSGLPLLGVVAIGFSVPGPAEAWESLWPALLALLLYFGVLRGRVPLIPPGDLLVPVERAGVRSLQLLGSYSLIATQRLEQLRLSWNSQRRRLGSADWLAPLEGKLMRWESAGLLLLTLGTLLVITLSRSGGG